MTANIQNEERIKVAVRCRPISSFEASSNKTEVVKLDTERKQVIVNNPRGEKSQNSNQFTFDNVIDQESSQENVYYSTALPIVESVIQGFNGTIFAYGQTGAGKTYTMEGNYDHPDNRGIIPRTFEHIYRVIESTPSKQFSVKASFLEVYNEEIRDLLAKNPKIQLKLQENLDLGVHVKDLSSQSAQNTQKMKEIFAKGREYRKVGSTFMNLSSSRSHSIFQITVNMNYEINGQEHIRIGKLNLVDLAGSESVQKTCATGQQLKEAININQSLLTLGNVISALYNRKPYIPYRDSKLTRLLQDALGGNAKTVMIANIGPVDYNYHETISTLRYVNRVKSINNRPKINEYLKNTVVKEFQDQTKHLKDELSMKMVGQFKIGSDGKLQKLQVENILRAQNIKARDFEKQIQRERQQLKSDGKKIKNNLREIIFDGDQRKNQKIN